MTDGKLEVVMRVCMAYYFVQQLGLDREPSDVRAERVQLLLVNRDEVEAAMKETGR